jgi:hypothetical protein
LFVLLTRQHDALPPAAKTVQLVLVDCSTWYLGQESVRAAKIISIKHGNETETMNDFAI